MARWSVFGGWVVVTGIVAVFAGLFTAPRAAGGDASATEPIPYMIVVTGRELLQGAYADSHTLFLTRTLKPLGFRCVGSMSVDDNVQELKDALHFATAKARLVIVTGGLGPTDNDITRQALAEFTGIRLEEDPQLVDRMARRFGVRPDGLRANLRIQTQVPVRGTYLINRNGTAAGLVFDAPRAMIIALPGPPRELQAMVREQLVAYLSRRLGTGTPGSSLTLRFVGIGQSGIDQVLDQRVSLAPDIIVSSTFADGRVDFTFSLPHDTTADRHRLEELKRAVMEYLGDYIYADDPATTLEQAVINRLAARGDTLAVAEVGSRGSLACGLASAEAAEQVLAGAYVAATEEALRRLLGVPAERWATAAAKDRLELLAQRAAAGTGGGWSVVVGAVQQGRLQVAVRSPRGVTVIFQAALRRADPEGRLRLSTQLLDKLRRLLR